MSSSGLGFVQAALQLGVNAILVKPQRGIGNLLPQVTLQEVHRDTLEITDHPVQQGATISDHAYSRPAEVIIHCAWSNSPTIPSFVGGLAAAPFQTVVGVQSILTGNAPQQVREVYQALLALQRNRQPFDVYTGKRAYRNMLIRDLTVTTDRQTENTLMVVAQLREVILVSTSTARLGEVPASARKDPESSTPTSNVGAKRLTAGDNFSQRFIDSISLPSYAKTP